VPAAVAAGGGPALGAGKEAEYAMLRFQVLQCSC